jgi:hypothetical protein
LGYYSFVADIYVESTKTMLRQVKIWLYKTNYKTKRISLALEQLIKAGIILLL